MAAKCVQGRGVMIDLHAHVGRKQVAVGYDQLMRILEADKVEVESGDMVCLHTGFFTSDIGDEQASPTRTRWSIPAPRSTGATRSC